MPLLQVPQQQQVQVRLPTAASASASGGLAVGQRIQMGGKTYLVAGSDPSTGQAILAPEQVQQQVILQPQQQVKLRLNSHGHVPILFITQHVKQLYTYLCSEGTSYFRCCLSNSSRFCCQASR